MSFTDQQAEKDEDEDESKQWKYYKQMLFLNDSMEFADFALRVVNVEEEESSNELIKLNDEDDRMVVGVVADSNNQLLNNEFLPSLNSSSNILLF